MSRRRFAPRFGGGRVQSARRPLDMGDLNGWRVFRDPHHVIQAGMRPEPTRCLVPSCTQPVHSRVYTTNREQIGACRHPLHQALMKRRQVVRTWYWEGV